MFGLCVVTMTWTAAAPPAAVLRAGPRPGSAAGVQVGLGLLDEQEGEVLPAQQEEFRGHEQGVVVAESAPGRLGTAGVRGEGQLQPLQSAAGAMRSWRR